MEEDSCHVHESSTPIKCQMRAIGSEETRLLGKACKCFSRNPAQVNDLNGVARLTSEWRGSFIP